MSGLVTAQEVIFAWSPILARWASGLEHSAWRERAETLARGAPISPDPLPDQADKKTLARLLRAARREALLTAALAETLSNDASVAFEWLTRSAEAWVRAAFDHAFRAVCERHHVRPDEVRGACPWAVLGLGKLGACEMNPSSDVDLVVVYAWDGPLTGGKGLTLHEVYDAVAREAAALLSEPTEDGICLRVDYDLRPEGRAGALTNSLEALQAYYEQYGSPLERMAWTRARPVAGDLFLGARVLDALSAFVYPRSRVSGALAALARVLGRLRGAPGTKRDGFNVKTGRGGIRDVELLVAAHQLLHGGRRPVLRTTRTLEALARLAEVGALAGREAEALAHAYRFLRRLEHLAQYREDRKTHVVPLEGPGAEALAAALGFDRARLLEALDHHRQSVVACADRLFDLGEPAKDPDAVLTVLDSDGDPSEREAAAVRLGFGDVEAVLAQVDRMRTAPQSLLHPRNEARFAGLDRQIVTLAAHSLWPDGAVWFLARLVRSPAHRPLFEMGREHPALVERLAEIGAQSTVLSDILARDPAVALEQALNGFQGGWPSPKDLESEALAAVGRADAEGLGEALAAFRRRHVASVALRDLGEAEAEVEVGRALSALADACIEAALRAAFGGEARRVAVLGLGRLGAREMGYRSDLDLIFVHDGPPERVLPFLHRALHLLTTRTVAGTLYALDLRLRPSGSQGPLLVAPREMKRYYEEDAGGAECLGALNLRAVAGERGLGDEVVGEVREVAARRLREQSLVEDLFRVRGLQHGGVAAGRKSAYDPKMEAGGMLDIETVARLHGLRGGIVPVGTVEALRGLREAGGRFGPDFAALERAYRFLWRLANRAHLVLDRALRDVPPEGPGAERLARVMGFRAGQEGLSPAGRLWQEVGGVLAEAARRCLGLVRALGKGGTDAESSRGGAP